MYNDDAGGPFIYLPIFSPFVFSTFAAKKVGLSSPIELSEINSASNHMIAMCDCSRFETVEKTASFATLLK